MEPTLVERLKKFHEEEGVSYKTVARNIDVSTGVMYNFTSDIRDLKPAAADRLDQYLTEHGY